jgi:putative transposase
MAPAWPSAALPLPNRTKNCKPNASATKPELIGFLLLYLWAAYQFNLIHRQMKIEYHNLYTHFIFTTLHRLPVIQEKYRQRIEKYITGIVNNNDSQLYAIYANPEHVHFLVSRSAKISEEGLATIVAESSERFINQNKLCSSEFVWQNSAAAFSVSKSDVDRVCKYILNQPEHHRKVTFTQEYERFIQFYQKTLIPGKTVE